jgi:regulatory protein
VKISDIKQQVKRANRYSIYADGKYVFSLSEQELVASGIRIGNEYTESEFEGLQQTAELDKAYMRALDLLARRPRSCWEMEQYLKRKDYDVSVVAKTLKHLNDRELLNDEAFARSWVASRRLLKQTSKQRLKQELRQKRVADDLITLVLEEDEATDMEMLQGLIEKKRRQTKYQDDEKLVQYLVRQGFYYSDIKGALNNSEET